MKESALTNKIIHALRVRGIYCEKIHGSVYQQAGLPDIWCVVDGQLICLEVKLSRGIVSKIQKIQIERLRKAGAVAEVVRSLDEALAVVEGRLLTNHGRTSRGTD